MLTDNPQQSLSLISAVVLSVLLAACGPSQQGESTALDGDQNTQTAGVVIEQSAMSGGGATELAAAKARVPHQYDERPPLNLFDFRTNLNPATNR